MNSKNTLLTVVTLLAAIVFSVTSCATISVNQDYDPGYDFSKLKTFGFIPVPAEAGIDQLSANRLGDAIKSELITKGFTLSEKADFGIALHFGKQTKTDVQSYGYGYGGGWGRVGMGGVDVMQYDEGTLIIDFIDMAKKELVWRGTGTGAMSDSPSVEQKTENVNNAVKQILAQFPPNKNQK